MENRTLFTAGNDDNDLQIVAEAGAKQIEVTSNCEWCGDTETGFGATVHVSITREEVVALRDFLDAWIAT